ncbi:hypothetical protein FGRMN_7251 [Fusarium graminum]|nr:hypothetical protein FGRMN_7251 [Fusarium graminum]
MPKPKANEDWAFTTAGIGYRTGHLTRKPFQVVRLRRGALRDSKNAKNSLENFDTSVPKFPLSDEELDYGKTSFASLIELVLIVGEYLEKPAKDFFDLPPTQDNVVSQYEHFNSDEHAHLDTQKTATVVKSLWDPEDCFYVLQGKKDGLCGMSKLPEINMSRGHIVFYREFLHGTRIGDEVYETPRVLCNVQKAAAEFIEGWDGPDVIRASDLPAEKTPPATMFTATAMRAWFAAVITSYNDTGSLQALGKVSEVSQCIIQGTLDSPGTFDETTELRMTQIRQLGHGHMTLEGAVKLIDAFKLLWPYPREQALMDAVLVPEAIMKLDAEIHEGGLACVVPTAPIIPDFAYKNFIYQFCVNFKYAHQCPVTVAVIYEVSELMGPYHPVPEFVTVAPLGSESSKNFVHVMQRLFKYLRDVIDNVWRGNVLATIGNMLARFGGVRGLADRLANTGDRTIATDLINEMMRQQGIALGVGIKHIDCMALASTKILDSISRDYEADRANTEDQAAGDASMTGT